MQCLAHHKTRLVSLVVAPAFLKARLGRMHLGFEQGLDCAAHVVIRLGRVQTRESRQQAGANRLLA